MINQNQKAVQVAVFGISLHQIQRWHGTLYVRKYVKPDLQVSHQHRSLMDKVSQTPESVSLLARMQNQNESNVHSELSQPHLFCGCSCEINHQIIGNLGPHDGSLGGDVQGLWPRYVANVVERLSLKLISYHICFLERPAPCNSHQSRTHQQGAIHLRRVLSRSSAVIGVAIHLCITPMYHLSSRIYAFLSY